jgi:hypothetical protein
MVGAVHVNGPAPKIIGARNSVPAQNNIPLKEGELPAGSFVSISLNVKNLGTQTKVRLRCGKTAEGELVLRVGEKSDRGSVQALSPEELFLSFDPGGWQAGCEVSAMLDNGAGAKSAAYVLGKVIRVPHIESFELTEEKNGDNYVGKLTGMDLENIAQVGWAADKGIPVAGLPVPEGRKQTLRIQLPWPAPSPHAPLFVWFRGEASGRETGIRY